MKNGTSLLAAFALALTLAGCKAADTHDADVAAIQATEAQWVKDFAAKDVDKLAAHYTDDGIFIMEDAPPITGRAAITAMLKQMVADPLLYVTFKPTEVDVSKSGDMAYSQGHYSTTMTDPASRQLTQGRGNYLTVYLRQPDGSWKATEDMLASDVPPQPAPPPAAVAKPAGKAFHPKPFD